MLQGRRRRHDPRVRVKLGLWPLRAGDGGEVERGDDDGAYCELVQDMGGDALPEESECDANGELERSRACACCNTSV